MLGPETKARSAGAVRAVGAGAIALAGLRVRTRSILAGYPAISQAVVRFQRLHCVLAPKGRAFCLRAASKVNTQQTLCGALRLTELGP